MSAISDTTVQHYRCFWCLDTLEPDRFITIESRAAGTIPTCLHCASAIGNEMIGEAWQRRWDLKQIPGPSIRRGGITFDVGADIAEAFEIARAAKTQP